VHVHGERSDPLVRRLRRLRVARSTFSAVRVIADVASLVSLQGVTPRRDLILEEGAQAVGGQYGLIVAWLTGSPSYRFAALSRGFMRGPLTIIDVVWGDGYINGQDFVWIPRRLGQLRDAPELLIDAAEVATAEIVILGRSRSGLGFRLMNSGEAWFFVNSPWAQLRASFTSRD